ncbi:hypothetical protein TKK_0005881 [Trichogramma kaykai]|uniref:Nucleolar protein 10 n=1 Tax=Trichogramma kaykai TaxID=54128 RepID=A0ABD2XG23_9HYME
MQASYNNDVKIYNLNAGKNIPDFLPAAKRKKLMKSDASIQNQIRLIQELDMPDVTTNIKISNDERYIFACGTYKPRMKCFDVHQLSMKFERCFDSEVVAFEVLSDDYTKLVFLQCDRHIEFHAAHGKYYRMRIPKFGRDLKFHYPSADLIVVGTSNEIYRLNLERGQFLQPFLSDSNCCNKVAINPEHQLLLVGTNDGRVEAWDHRVKKKVGTLDCGFGCIKNNTNLDTVPSITALNCQGALTVGVGTVTGQVLLYDIRSNSPFTVKDHMYGLPIRNIEFHYSMDLVYSMDSSVIKIWNKDNGKMYTSIEAEDAFNDFCVFPNTGMIYTANESPKMLTYYIPSLGPAPKWCGNLDSHIDDFEYKNTQTLYENYKFVTKEELDELDLQNTPFLLEKNLLRAHMHGYFMNLKLYNKFRALKRPFEFEEFKKQKISSKIQEERPKRVQVNPEASISSIVDDRFKSLLSRDEFKIDVNSELYALTNPVVASLSKPKLIEYDGNSSEDEKPWGKEVGKAMKARRQAAFEDRIDKETVEPQQTRGNKSMTFVPRSNKFNKRKR